MHANAGSTNHDPVTLTFDLLTSGSMNAEDLLNTYIMYVPSLVSIAQAIFTARCTTVQSAVLRLHAICLSVCLSVTLVDHDHIG